MERVDFCSKVLDNVLKSCKKDPPSYARQIDEQSWTQIDFCSKLLGNVLKSCKKDPPSCARQMDEQSWTQILALTSTTKITPSITAIKNNDDDSKSNSESGSSKNHDSNSRSLNQLTAHNNITGKNGERDVLCYVSRRLRWRKSTSCYKR